jgi:hypothetical protein
VRPLSLSEYCFQLWHGDDPVLLDRLISHHGEVLANQPGDLVLSLRGDLVLQTQVLSISD